MQGNRFSSALILCGTRVLLILCLLVMDLPWLHAASHVSLLPDNKILLTWGQKQEPVLTRGIRVNPQLPNQFDLIIDNGQQSQTGVSKAEIERLTKYFLTSLAIPQKDIWVNLSPYEPNRLLSGDLAQTDMGRDLLAQDVWLKHLTAKWMDPQNPSSASIWKSINEKLIDSPVNQQQLLDSLHKIWIVPGDVHIYEQSQTAIILNAHLRVLIKEDPALLNKQSDAMGDLLRKHLIPEIEREVNEGPYFSRLRQIYHAFLLALWFKQKAKTHPWYKALVDQYQIKGFAVKQDRIPFIYRRYLSSFKHGAYVYIQEPKQALLASTPGKAIKFISGGVLFKEGEITIDSTISRAQISQLEKKSLQKTRITLSDKATLVPPRIDSIQPVLGNEKDKIIQTMIKAQQEWLRTFYEKFLNQLNEEQRKKMLGVDTFLKQVESQMKVTIPNKGNIFRDPRGELWYEKKAKEIFNRGQREKLASLIAKEIGAKAPDIKVFWDEQYFSKIIIPKTGGVSNKEESKKIANLNLIFTVLVGKMDSFYPNMVSDGQNRYEIDNDYVLDLSFPDFEVDVDKFLRGFLYHNLIVFLTRALKTEYVNSNDKVDLTWDKNAPLIMSSKFLSDPKKSMSYLQGLSKDWGIGQALIKAYDWDENILRDLIERVRVLTDERLIELIKEAGYVGQDIENRFKLLKKQRDLLKIIMDRLWFMLDGKSLFKSETNHKSMPLINSYQSPFLLNTLNWSQFKNEGGWSYKVDPRNANQLIVFPEASVEMTKDTGEAYQRIYQKAYDMLLSVYPQQILWPKEFFWIQRENREINFEDFLNKFPENLKKDKIKGIIKLLKESGMIQPMSKGGYFYVIVEEIAENRLIRLSPQDKELIQEFYQFIKINLDRRVKQMAFACDKPIESHDEQLLYDQRKDIQRAFELVVNNSLIGESVEGISVERNPTWIIRVANRGRVYPLMLNPLSLTTNQAQVANPGGIDFSFANSLEKINENNAQESWPHPQINMIGIQSIEMNLPVQLDMLLPQES